jgi:hypothetical protein
LEVLSLWIIGLNVVVSKLGDVEKVMSLGRELAQENSEEGEGDK